MRTKQAAEEDRIRKQYKKLKQDRLTTNSDIMMQLARQWKRPCAEITRILGNGERKEQRKQHYEKMRERRDQCRLFVQRIQCMNLTNKDQK